MVIRLNEELMLNSHKTIDGRGANIHIAYGAQITAQFVHHIILHNLHIHHLSPGNGAMIRDSPSHYGLRTRSDGDGISIYGSSHIWIDHISMSACADGLIDAIMGSTAITISNCHMSNHDDVMLFGASDAYADDALMQVTVAFNHFGRGLVQRMPRCRWGFVHVVNNDYTHWRMYAVGGSQHPTVISQGNRYIAPHDGNAKEVTKRDYATDEVWRKWTWRSQGDLMMNGAYFVESGEEFVSGYARQDVMKARPGTFVTRLTRYAGALGCRIGLPC
ncbi:pectate lyase-like [Phalaenopsis equestris]|uniref:pectate lyase-like n=1 Tax=Phalaenopsis equestris TaxID=78828 RepID=UPI0009E3257B|nr:pectate lyase-like [Phalaenopsis equestris]